MSERVFTLAIFDVIEVKWRAFVTDRDSERVRAMCALLEKLAPVPCVVVEPPGSSDDEIGDFVEGMAVPIPEDMVLLYRAALGAAMDFERAVRELMARVASVKKDVMN